MSDKTLAIRLMPPKKAEPPAVGGSSNSLPRFDAAKWAIRLTPSKKGAK